ncbi:gamma-glutamylcyclotransferase family protein [Tundrisphaera lichenicola]|uniref:gamma-glutamylcyclotransferase family protein n=1 Tax=Tundrisphaera lichenicola TaxID=2029860 RepID=UPI003EBD5AB5
MSEALEPATRFRGPWLLFAYGTLAPDGPRAMAVGGWTVDAARGRLFDLGPYPGLVDENDPTAGWVEGYVRPVDESELRERLDPYEGVEDGLFRRVVTTTRAGRVVWIYVYAKALPRDARGPLPRWEGLRGRFAPRSPGEDLDDGYRDQTSATR